jgi:hypothetical protein
MVGKNVQLSRVAAIGALIAVNAVLWPFIYEQIKPNPPAIAQARTTNAANGFDLSNPRIPTDEIYRGGPPRDGIPAILDPKFIPVAEADYLEAEDEVIAFESGGVARAYPLRILVWHEIANDIVGGVPIAVTYCPLCGTAMVFDRRYDDKILTFGVSGLLYQSDVLMYDHQTESLWSQLKMEAVSGPMAGTALTWLPAAQTTWAAWREEHPDGEVLSTDTGHMRNYGHTPYADYENVDRIMFPVPETRDDLPNKTWVAGILVNGEAKAYSLDALASLDGEPYEDQVGGEAIVVKHDPRSGAVTVTHGETGEAIPSVRSYWFAWQAFYPNTGLYSQVD